MENGVKPPTWTIMDHLGDRWFSWTHRLLFGLEDVTLVSILVTFLGMLLTFGTIAIGVPLAVMWVAIR